MLLLFSQGLELTVRIASTLHELLMMGHVKYRTFEGRFCLNSDGIIDQLQKMAKQMETDLDEWRTNVEHLRTKYYHMNYFTARQLSLICHELSNLHTVTHHSVKPWFINLIQSVCPTLDTGRLVTAAVMVAEERERVKKSAFFGIRRSDSALPLIEDEEPPDSVNKDDNETLQSMYTQQALIVDDLNETQHKLFQELQAYKFLDSDILTALTEVKGSKFDDLFDYCFEHSQRSVELVSERALAVEPQVIAQDTEPAEMALNENHPMVREMIEAGFDLELAIEAAEVCNCNSKQMFDYCLEKGSASNDRKEFKHISE